MTQTINLDPIKTQPLKPKQQNKYGWSSISSFDVPIGLGLLEVNGLIGQIHFLYDGGDSVNDKASTETRPDMIVTTGVSQSSGRLLSLKFFPPIQISDLSTVAAHLTEQAEKFERLSARYSFLMVARLLENWEEMINSSTTPPKEC